LDLSLKNEIIENLEMNKSLTDHVERLMREKTIDEALAE